MLTCQTEQFHGMSVELLIVVHHFAHIVSWLSQFEGYLIALVIQRINQTLCIYHSTISTIL